ncbi:hypothetical protein BsWGS_25539 [Bradybaena similaris]
MKTRAYKTKVRVIQQYQQAVPLKQLSHQETPQFRDCQVSDPQPTKSTPPMSTEWNVLPFAFPVKEGDEERCEKINEILMFSLKQQKENEVSDITGFVTIVISRCLEAVGVSNQVDCGYRHIVEGSYPHMWLVVDGYVIDNTYIKDLQALSLKHICKNTPKCYESCDFSKKPNLKSSSATNDTTTTRFKTKTRIDFYLRNSDKALAIGLNKWQSFNYYFSMIRYMYDNHRCCIVGIDPKVRSVCWWCDCYPKSGRAFLSDIVRPSDFKETDTSSKVTWQFQHCSHCTVANYCSERCQKADWLDNHHITCFSRDSAHLPPLSDNPYNADTP